MRLRAGRSKLEIFSWILYDFSNTIYSMNVVTMYFSLWITVNLAKEDIWVSAGNSTSMLLVALSMPALGVISDIRRRRMPFLIGLTLICVAFTALIGAANYLIDDVTGKAVAAVVFFTIANFAYQGGLVFYNAILPDIAPEGSIGRISGYGVSMGYLGAIVGLLMVMPFSMGGIPFMGLEIASLNSGYEEVAELSPADSSYLDADVDMNANYSYKVLPMGRTRPLPGVSAQSSDTLLVESGVRRRAVVVKWDKIYGAERLKLVRRRSGWGRAGTFIPTAILFLIFSIPTFAFVRDRAGGAVRTKLSLGYVYHKVWEGISDTRRYPGVLRFLVAKFFYEEGIQTVIIFMAVYASKAMRFPDSAIIPLFIVSTTSAVIGSALFGILSDRLGPKRTLVLVLTGWVLTLAGVILTESTPVFWVLGSLVGIFMGATWTSARPLLVSLVPREMLGEFFGLYALSGKVAAISGPLIWGGVVLALKSYGDGVRYRAAVGALALMISVGLVLLLKVPDRWRR